MEIWQKGLICVRVRSKDGKHTKSDVIMVVLVERIIKTFVILF